jgi:hypothetical protein
MAGICLRNKVWCAGHGAEAPWQYLNQLQSSLNPTALLSVLCVSAIPARNLPSALSFDYRISNLDLPNSRRHRVIPLQRLLNRLRRNRPLTPDAPMLPAQLHNRRRHQFPSLSRIQYQWNPIAQLLQHFFRAAASTRPRKIRAGSRQRHSDLLDQAANNLILRPPQRNPPRIRRNLQRQPVRRLHHHRQRPGPASLCQPVKVRRQIPRESPRLRQRINQNWQRPRFRPPLHAKNLFHRRQVHRVRRQRIQSIRGNGNHRATP